MVHKKHENGFPLPIPLNLVSFVLQTHCMEKIPLELLLIIAAYNEFREILPIVLAELRNIARNENSQHRLLSFATCSNSHGIALFQAYVNVLVKLSDEHALNTLNRLYWNPTQEHASWSVTRRSKFLPILRFYLQEASTEDVKLLLHLCKMQFFVFKDSDIQDLTVCLQENKKLFLLADFFRALKPQITKLKGERWILIVLKTLCKNALLITNIVFVILKGIIPDVDLTIFTKKDIQKLQSELYEFLYAYAHSKYDHLKSHRIGFWKYEFDRKLITHYVERKLFRFVGLRKSMWLATFKGFKLEFPYKKRQPSNGEGRYRRGINRRRRRNTKLK